MLDAPATLFAWSVPFAVRSVTVDPHSYVLHWTRATANDYRALAPAKRANMLEQVGRTAEALVAFTAGLDSVPANDTHGLRYLLEYGLGWMHLNAGRWDEAKTHMQSALASPSLPATNGSACRAPGGNCAVPWGYYVLAKAAQQLGDSALLCQAVSRAVAADTASRWGAGQQARALGPRCR